MRPSPELSRLLGELLEKEFDNNIADWCEAVTAQQRREITAQQASTDRLRVDWQAIDDAMYGWAAELLEQVEDNPRLPPEVIAAKKAFDQGKALRIVH